MLFFVIVYILFKYFQRIRESYLCLQWNMNFSFGL
jgi:hypothetical protein